MLRVLIAAVVVLAAGCAPAYHPIMLCSQVGPNLLACMDSDQYNKIQGSPDEPLQPKPQSLPQVDPKTGA